MTLRLKYFTLPALSWALSAGLAHAQYQPTIPPTIAPAPHTPGPITSPQGIVNLINIVLYRVATIFWIAAAGFIFYAAFLYLTAGGDSERVKKAHKQLLYAIIAIAVGLMAYGLPLLVYNFLAAGGGLGICIGSFCF